MAQKDADVFPGGASLFSCIYQALICISLSSYSLATARLKNQLPESIEKTLRQEPEKPKLPLDT
jgi:hypothetical protein